MITTTYAIYDLTSGAVRWFMTSEPEHIDNSTPSGCGWIEVDNTPDGSWHVDLGTKTLVSGALDLRSLDQVKLDQWALIKANRDATLAGGFEWNSMHFQSDATSQQQIIGAVQLAALVSTITIPWTLTDNTVVSLSAADMQNVGIALGQFVQTTYAKGVTLRGQINDATSIEAVQAITWA